MNEPIFAVVPLPVIRDTSLSVTDRLVFCVLCALGNIDTGMCFPSLEIIAEAVGVSEKTVQRAILRLIEAGYVRRDFCAGADGRSMSNGYAIVWWSDDRGGCHPCPGGEDKNEFSGLYNNNNIINNNIIASKKERKKERNKKERKKERNSEDEEEVFRYWVEVMGRDRRTSFDANQRRTRVRARLAEGFTVEDLKLAILGCKLNPWNQGENPTGVIYDDLELICRNEAKVRHFMQCAMKLGNGKELSRIREVRQILQLAGETAARALAQEYGISWEKVVGGDGGRP